VRTGSGELKTTVELINEKKQFWAGLRMLVLQRQPGISWSDSGKMMIDDFFHVLKLSEKAEKERHGRTDDRPKPSIRPTR
jgi:hypothetical protein